MRIIAGRWRGRLLTPPKSHAIRPTSDRAREALFSALEHRLGEFNDLRVADVFAGTGALGIEALSRGAASATFVDASNEAERIIKENLAVLGAASLGQVMRINISGLPISKVPYDVVFLDPPYRQNLATPALTSLLEQGWIGPASWIAIETGRDEEIELDQFTVERDAFYGKARSRLLRVA